MQGLNEEKINSPNNYQKNNLVINPNSKKLGDHGKKELIMLPKEMA